jgi:hypothetical protein
MPNHFLTTLFFLVYTSTLSANSWAPQVGNAALVVAMTDEEDDEEDEELDETSSHPLKRATSDAFTSHTPSHTPSKHREKHAYRRHSSRRPHSGSYPKHQSGGHSKLNGVNQPVRKKSRSARSQR